MDYTKLAIEKAIEGGWTSCLDNDSKFSHMDDARGGFWFFDEDGTGLYLEWERVMLDKTFWQSLAKAEGWSEFGSHETKGNNLRCYRCGERFDDPNPCTKNPLKMWKMQWHRFIDSLADGHTPEEYFKQILSKSK